MGTSVCRLTSKAGEMLPVPGESRASAWETPATHNRPSLTDFAGKWFPKQGVWQDSLLQGGHFGTLAALSCFYCPTIHTVQQSAWDGETQGRCQPGLGRRNLSCSLGFLCSLCHCCSCHLPVAPSCPVWNWTEAVVGMGLHYWDLLGGLEPEDVGLQGQWDPSPLHPRRERDARALCGWRKRTPCSTLRCSLCFPPPSAALRSHPALTGLWHPAGLGVCLPKGKGVSDHRRRLLELGTAAGAGYKCSGDSWERVCSHLLVSDAWTPILFQGRQLLWLLGWLFLPSGPALRCKGYGDVRVCPLGCFSGHVLPSASTNHFDLTAGFSR